MSERQEKDSTVEFFVLTFVVTWLSWTAWALSRVEPPAAPVVRMGGGILFFVGVFAPALVAMWLARKYGGPQEFRALLSRVLQVDVGLRWYVFALTYFFVVKLAVVVLYRLLLGEWPALSEESWYLMLGGVLISTPAQFGEEGGWRGYALPRLATHFGFGPACVLLGVIWAAWHLPLFYIPNTEMTGQPFLPYMLGVTAISVAIGWLYLNTRGSLFLAMLMHSAINNTNIAPYRDPNSSNVFGLGLAPLPWLTVGLLWIGALYFLFRMRRTSPTLLSAFET